MKKVYLALLLLPAVSNIAFSGYTQMRGKPHRDLYPSSSINDTDMNNTNMDHDDIDMQDLEASYDPCSKTFTMESEEDLKQLLRDHGFHYYDEKTELSKKLADREIYPSGVVNQVIFANYDFNKTMETGDEEDDLITKTQTTMATPNLIKTLLTNHPEAIECLKQKGVLKDLYDPCKTFIMESEKDLKKLLRDHDFDYYDEKTKLSKKLADREINPFGVVNQVVFANYDFNKYMETGDEEHDLITKTQTTMATLDLIKTLLTNHPEAIECLKQKGVLNKYEDEN